MRGDRKKRRRGKKRLRKKGPSSNMQVNMELVVKDEEGSEDGEKVWTETFRLYPVINEEPQEV